MHMYALSTSHILDVNFCIRRSTVLCIQTVELVLFYILIHNSAILQAIHTKYISKLSAIHADQIDIKSCDYHVTKMAA